MIQQIFPLLYFLFFLGIVVSGMFIVYHITKYSLSKKNAFWGNIVFLVGLGILLLINATSFFSVDWNSVQLAPMPQKTQVW